jgi:hypothetical protein
MVVMAVVEVVEIARFDFVANDFRGTLWEPARAVLHGGDPYAYAGSVYPASAFVPLVPLGALPFDVAAVIWVALSLAAAAGTLGVLDVRDWRCYVLWLLNSAVLSTAVTGNATVIVGLSLALLFRYRDAASGPLSLAAGTAVKLFVAPLVLWLAFTGRVRAAVIACAYTTVAVFVAWATIGFRGLAGYPDQLGDNDRTFSGDTPLVQGLVQQLGGSEGLALAIGLAVAVALLVGAWGRRRDEAGSFALVLAAAIVASPIAWVGYATLLFVPLAARTPRFTPAWLLLLVFSYAHWWHSTFVSRSAALSVVTIIPAALVLWSCLRIADRDGSPSPRMI